MRLTGFAALCLLFANCASFAYSPALSLKLTAVDPNVKVSGKIVVRVTTVNESNETITYHNTNSYCNYSFKVLTSAGAPAPETSFMKQLSCNGPLPMSGRDIVVTLKAGESNSEDLRLSELYDLSQPGEYSVQVDRTFPGIGHFSSNSVNINVAP